MMVLTKLLMEKKLKLQGKMSNNEKHKPALFPPNVNKLANKFRYFEAFHISEEYIAVKFLIMNTSVLACHWQCHNSPFLHHTHIIDK